MKVRKPDEGNRTEGGRRAETVLCAVCIYIYICFKNRALRPRK
jgi:hypothetical protein